MSAKDTTTIEDLRRIAEILEQRMYEIECTSRPSFRHLKEVLNLVERTMAQLE